MQPDVLARTGGRFLALKSGQVTAAAVGLALLGGAQSILHAQTVQPPFPESISSSASGADIGVAAANVAFGALIGGIARTVQGESLWSGFWQGAVGGGVSFAGKRLAMLEAERPGRGLGLLGREVAAIGASMSRAAAFGSGPLDSLILPLGPMRLYLTPRHLRASRVRVDLEEIAWLGYATFSERFVFHPGRSISSGTLVFSSADRLHSGGRRVNGRAVSGMLFLDEVYFEAALPHELVHVLQIDYLKITAGLPLEGWGRRQLGMISSRPWRWVDLGIAQYPFQILALRAMEWEAASLERSASSVSIPGGLSGMSWSAGTLALFVPPYPNSPSTTTSATPIIAPSR